RAEGGAEILGAVVKAVDMWPHEAHAVLAPDLHQPRLPGDIARLGESGRNQHRACDLLFAHFNESAGNELCGNGEYGDVDLARHILDALIGLPAHDALSVRVNWINRSLITSI